MKFFSPLVVSHEIPSKDEKAAEAAMDVEEPESSNAAAQPKAGEDKAGSTLHVLGIGGRRAKRGTAKASGTKKTPGEIRIQKGKVKARVQ